MIVRIWTKLGDSYIDEVQDWGSVHKFCVWETEKLKKEQLTSEFKKD